MEFKVIKSTVEGIIVIEPRLYTDCRGFFMETFSQRDLQAVGINDPFVQDNHSKSARGVLRGMHYQSRNSQAKLVRVTRGSVYDLAVDLRPTSRTFMKWHGQLLSEQNKMMMYIPKGFAHGFLAIEEGSELQYKCSDYYDPDAEKGARWDDPLLAIDWRLEEFGLDPKQIIIAERDAKFPDLCSAIGPK